MAFIKGRAYPMIKNAAEGTGEKAQLAKEILANLESMSQDELDAKLNDFFGGAGASAEAQGQSQEKTKTEGVTKTGKLNIGILDAKRQMPGNRDNDTFTPGAINDYFKIKNVTTQKMVEDIAEKIGFTQDPEIAKALKEFELDFNDPSRQTIIQDEQTGNLVYNMGSPEANAAREAKGQEWLNEELAKQNQTREIKKDRQAYIVVGLPGSGKSTTADPMLSTFGAYEIDADIFKDYMPEMKGDENRAAAVHEESGILRDKFMNEVAKEGANLVLPMVGSKLSKIKKRIDSLKKLGYNDFHLVNAFAPLDKALERNVKRFRSKKRKKAPLRLVGLQTYEDDSIEKINNAFEESITALKDDIKSWAVYDGSADNVDATFVDGSDNWEDVIAKK